MKRFIHKTFQALILAALLFLAGRSIWSLFQDKTISLPEINKSNNVNPPVKKMSSVSSIIKNTVNSNKVALFTKTYCPYCKKAKDLFKEMNVEFYALELDTHEKGSELQSELAKMTGQKTVPNVFVNGHHVGGCDDTVNAKADGSLAKLLSGERKQF